MLYFPDYPLFVSVHWGELLSSKIWGNFRNNEVRKMTRIFTALVLASLTAFQALAQAEAFDYKSLVGKYTSSGCMGADGADGQAQAAKPIDAWDGTVFLITEENAGLTVTTPEANVKDYFASTFGQINKGPHSVGASNPAMGMTETGFATVTTTRHGVVSTTKSSISTPIGGDNGFTFVGELTVTNGTVLYKLTNISPDPAQGPNVKWIDWHSCILSKTN
jgi:hypothetical protein